MSDSLQPYRPLHPIDQNLYCVDGEWFQTAFHRRMTVIRLRDGGLAIHSAIRMEEKDLRELDQLGPVSTIIVPNAFHDSDAPFFAERYPRAKVYVPAKIRAKCLRKMRVNGILETDWPFQEELPSISFLNSLASETVFVHRASRTLIVTDMAFNVNANDFKNPVERLIFGKWNGLLNGLGPSHLTKWVIARDRSCVGEAILKVAAHDFDRVIMSHGTIVSTDGKQRFLDGYARVYGVLQ